MFFIELSAVLYDMTIKGSIPPKGALGVILLIITAVLWFILTVGILLLMEGLSAFLHALRLHWYKSFFLGGFLVFFFNKK